MATPSSEARQLSINAYMNTLILSLLPLCRASKDVVSKISRFKPRVLCWTPGYPWIQVALTPKPSEPPRTSQNLASHNLIQTMLNLIMSLTYGRNICFLSPLVQSKQENLALLTLYIFSGKCFFFQFLNDKIHNYVKQNIVVTFIIQKLKNKHTFLKKYTNWAKLSSLVLSSVGP